MIFCNLKGGLGNMLFQIAAVKSMSLKYNRKYSFPNLNHQLNYLNLEQNYNPSLSHSNEYFKVFKNLPIINPTNNNIATIPFPFEYRDITLPENNVIVDGFFQSEKYFISHREQILEMFKMDEDVSQYIKIKYSNFLNKRTTSIHVRRGDYLIYPNFHPTQTLNYYNSSISLLDDVTDLFLIFSDDIEWCKENLTGEKFIYIENEKDYIELYLMSLCKNNVISNSSFSWWGAWLNNYEDRQIVGPKIWFGESIEHKISDIIPDNWIKL
jgi:hypothetical protein